MSMSLAELAQKYENAYKAAEDAKTALAVALMNNGMATELEWKTKPPAVMGPVSPLAGDWSSAVKFRRPPRKAGRPKKETNGQTNAVVAAIKNGKHTRSTIIPWLVKQEKISEGAAAQRIVGAKASGLIKSAGRGGYKLA